MLRVLDELSRALKIKPAPQYTRPPPRQVSRVAYLPVEVSSRELLGKSIAAKGLLELGFQVVLGARWQLNHNQYVGLPRGIFLFKTLNALDTLNMHWAQENGHIAVALDEEMFPMRPNISWYRAFTNPNAVDLVDVICAPGQKSNEMFKKISSAEVLTTGSPRCVIPKINVGEDILVCTMAGIANSARAFHENMILICQIFNKPLVGEFLDYYRDKVRQECKEFGLLLEVIQELSRKYPDRRIRVRVHPAENVSAYQITGNVVLDTSPSFIDALHGAATLVYVSGCSTGIESFMAKVPAVRLGDDGHGLSCDLHIGANTAEAALEAVHRQLTDPQIVGDMSEHFSPLTLAQDLAALQERNSLGETDGADASQFNLGDQFAPDESMRFKFPETSEEQIKALTSARSVKAIGWNTWLLN